MFSWFCWDWLLVEDKKSSSSTEKFSNNNGCVEMKEITQFNNNPPAVENLKKLNALDIGDGDMTKIPTSYSGIIYYDDDKNGLCEGVAYTCKGKLSGYFWDWIDGEYGHSELKEYGYYKNGVLIANARKLNEKKECSIDLFKQIKD